jgi:hypothetical protein
MNFDEIEQTRIDEEQDRLKQTFPTATFPLCYPVKENSAKREGGNMCGMTVGNQRITPKRAQKLPNV